VEAGTRESGPGGAPPGAGPGTLTRLLEELARAPPGEPERAWAQGLRPGDVLDRFEILRELGRGGFGAVYEALDRELGRRVALKTLRPGRSRDEWADEQLRREAHAAASLSHPGVVTLHEARTCDRGPYLVMELLRGETLEKRLSRGPLPVGQAVEVGLQAARALAHVHGHDLVHRDLKPGNVFLGEDGRVKLLDLGLAHLLGRRSSTGGTPAYVAPEQWRGEEVDGRADVFALGAVLFEAVSGRRAFEVKEERSTALDPEPPPALHGKLPRDLVRLVARCLAKDPRGRPTAAQAAEELLAVQRQLERARAVPRLAVLVAAGVLVGVAVVSAALWRRGPRAPEAGPDGRLVVAVADFSNQTAEAELDALGGLLITSLEQARMLRVLPRGRLVELLRDRGARDVRVIDEVAGREAARQAGARALLLATIHRFGSRYTVDLRAIDPVRDESLFSVKETTDARDGIPDLIDRLAARGLRELPVASGELSAPGARTLTSNLTAAARYYAALDHYAAGRYQDAERALEEAVSLDAEFSAAWMRLAFYHSMNPSAAKKTHGEIERAQRFAARLPDKERRMLEGWTAYADKRLEDVRRIFSEALARYPDDRDLADMAGETLWHAWGDRGHSEDYGAAAEEILAASLDRDPANELALSHLVWRYCWTGRAGLALERARRAVARRASPQNLAMLAYATMRHGDLEEALDPARRAFEEGGRTNWDVVNTYAMALHGVGRFEDAVGILESNSVNRLWGANVAVKPDAAVGKVRRAVERIAKAGPIPGELAEEFEAWKSEASAYVPWLMGDTRGLPVLLARAPAWAAISLARAGDLERARRVDLGSEDGVARRTVEAVIACRSGRPDEAAPIFEELRKERHIGFFGGHLWSELEWADCLSALGRPVEAKASYEFILGVYRGGQVDEPHVFVRARLGVAESLAALGQEREALAHLEPLIELWKGADRGVPVVEQGRALHARLAASVRR
jgi:tetratricopeptide (TPR) repeat protein